MNSASHRGMSVCCSGTEHIAAVSRSTMTSHADDVTSTGVMSLPATGRRALAPRPLYVKTLGRCTNFIISIID